MDRSGVLELTHETVRRAHAGVAETCALPAVVRSCGRAGLLREREEGLLERRHVVHPVVRVQMCGLATDETLHAAVLRAVFGERLVRVGPAGAQEISEPQELAGG